MAQPVLQSIQEDASYQSNLISIAGTTTGTILLPANAFRTEAVIQNDSSAVLYIAYGLPATSSSYTASLAQNDVLNTDFGGDIYGVWASATGNARITEVQVKK